MRDSSSLLEGKTTGEVLRLFYRVYDRLGFGHLESVYTNALAREFAAAGLPFVREALVDVWYKGRRMGQFRADFLVRTRVVVEAKSCALLSDAHRRQLLNYLRCSRLEVGLLLHFGQKSVVRKDDPHERSKARLAGELPALTRSRSRLPGLA